MNRSDEELLSDALNHIAILKSHLERGDLADETVVDAVSLRLAAAIEAAAQISIVARDRVFGDDWKIIWGTRNRIAHGYAHIDLDIVRATVEQDLPDFERKLREAIEGT